MRAFRAVLGRRDGFTLIELVVAFGILAVAAAVAVPAFLRLLEEDDLTTASRRVETLFRLARDSAIAGGAPVTVVIDSISGLVWLDVPPRLGDDEANSVADSIDGPTSLELPGTVTLELPAARTRFSFAASGQAFGEHLVLRSPLGEHTLSLDPWTGDVLLR